MMHSYAHAQSIKYPQTQKEKVEDNYFGTKVADPYRWLENDTSQKTAAWVKEQNAVTKAYLDNIPERRAFFSRLTDVWNYEKQGLPQQYGDYLFYYKNNGLQNQSVLYYTNLKTGKEDVLLDPNTLSKDGTIAIQGTAVSKNQKYFAYALSASGSDWQDIYIMELATKKLLTEKISNVKFSSMEWQDDEGFFYNGYDKPVNEATKYSAKTEFQKVFYHKIGTDPSTDNIVYQDTLNPLRYVRPQLTQNGRYLILNISEGTNGNEIKVKDLRQKSGDFVTLIPGFSTNAYVLETLGDKLAVVTNENADNYKIVTTDLKNNKFTPFETLIAPTENKLVSARIFGNKIFASYLRRATSQMVVYNEKGEVIKSNLPNFENVTLSGFGGKKDAKVTYFSVNSYTQPPQIIQYNIEKDELALHFKPTVQFDSEQFKTEQIEIISKDGTSLTAFVVSGKNVVLDGKNPTLLYGYGGFNINLTPSFNPAIIPFLERGGIYVVANLRGGGEYGETWHKDGMLDKKQNVFDDFISVAEFLIAHNYTSKDYLAIQGGSNGGLLVGACMTQRPDLFKVAFPQVGVLDMLRYHKFTVGWGWVVEYGSSDVASDFKYLYKYSPLHNLKKGTCYPATMITTADHDDRVVPAHSFKFAAALQEAQGCNNPTLIRIDVNAGHGAGKPTAKSIEEYADIWAFMFHQLPK